MWQFYESPGGEKGCFRRKIKYVSPSRLPIVPLEALPAVQTTKANVQPVVAVVTVVAGV